MGGTGWATGAVAGPDRPVGAFTRGRIIPATSEHLPERSPGRSPKRPAPRGGRAQAEYAMTLNTAPCGSCSTAMQPTPGTSIGGTSVWPPSAVHLAKVSSTLSTVM